jgi:large subunit ribosomal protein L15
MPWVNSNKQNNMEMHQLPKIVARHAKRVGRGIGSGKGGHTSGRGTKGQKARETVKLDFEGTKFKKSLLKRLPFLRGKGKFKPWGEKVVLSLNDFKEWPEKSEVTIQSLIKAGWITTVGTKVKILAEGEIKQALTVKIPVSAGAREKIVKAGGKVELSV